MGYRKKTNDEFVAEMNSINNNIELLDIYDGRKKKIKVRCKIDDYIWEITPDNLLKGKGCPKCAGNIKKTHSEFISEVANIHKYIEIIGKYINNSTKIECYCKIHDYKFSINPSSLLKGYGCPYCSNHFKTHEQFLNDLNKINKNLTVLSKYEHMNKKIIVKCNLDGYEWSTLPLELLRGHGCPKCAGKLKRTHKEFVEDLKLIYDEVNVIGEFIDLQHRVKVKCTKCNHEWNPVANSLLQGTKCPNCRIISKTKTHEQFINELYELNPNIEVIDTYINAHTKIKVKCLIDKNEWYAKPANLLSGFGCPVCNKSKGEKSIQKYLDSHNIINIPQMKYDSLIGIGNGLLSYDFYLPTYNLLIEYQGEQHEHFIKGFHKTKKDFEKQKEHDRRKKLYAIDNNIKLLEIWYYDYINVEDILNFSLFSL